MANVPLFLWLCTLCIISILCSLFNLKHLTLFYQSRECQFIKQRKPIVVLIYGTLASLTLCLIIPSICAYIYLSSSQQHTASAPAKWHFQRFVFDCIYEPICCTFINMIAIRVWLLFYDHSFAMATVDRVWRKVINPSERNFFLHHRNTVGNSTFLLKLLPVSWASVLCVLVLLTGTYCVPATFSTLSTHKLIFFASRVLFGAPALLFIVAIHHKIHKINDQFHIRTEIKYLFYLVCFATFYDVIALVLLMVGSVPLYIFETILYSFDVLFIGGTCFVQTKFVLCLLTNSLNRAECEQPNVPLSMADCLRHKYSFELFMRHCVNELSVESLLFLVEVAQFKATFASYNATDKASVFCSLNVETANLREILLNNRKQATEPDEPETPSDPKPMTLSLMPLPLLLEKSLSKKSQDECTSQPDAESSAAGTVDPFRQFQASILHRTWLPISKQFQISRANQTNPLIENDGLASKSQLSLSIIRDPASLEEKQSDYNCQSQSVSSTRTVLGNLTVTQCEPLPEPFRVPAVKRADSVYSLRPDAIRDVAAFLYEKYIRTDSDLSVNISFEKRKFLNELFRFGNEDMFAYILAHSGGCYDRTEACPAAINQQLLVNTYLYHVFDAAFEEIWTLLRIDTFRRFSFTESYRKLIEQRESAAARQQNCDTKEVEVVCSA